MPTRTHGCAIIAAGGTGGHIYPGVAVADEIRQREPGTRIVFVGTRRGLEQRLVPRAGYELVLLPIRPLNAVGLGRMLVGLATLPWAMLRALTLLLRLRPRAVLGVGGYAGGPVVLVAALAGIPTVLLEPNAHPGLTNRVLRPFVRHAACGYQETCAHFGSKGILTGNPVRGGFASLQPRPDAGIPTLLVFGGSQGAAILNTAMIAALPHLPPAEALAIFHQTGPREHARTLEAYRQAGRDAEVVPFIDDMEKRFGESDVILCRSGATTCAELTVGGKAAILVPFARAANDHQTVNARALAAAGAAVMVPEAEADGPRLAAEIRRLVENREQRLAMEKAAHSLGRSDAAARVAALMGFTVSGEGHA